MADHIDEKANSPAHEINAERRSFMKAAATAGLLGAAGSSLGYEPQSEAAQEAAVENPQAPPGLGPLAIPDARFPMNYAIPVPKAVGVLTEYFAALSQRNLNGMAEALHFPFASFEGTDPVIVKTPEDLIAHAPASMNMTEKPERFTDHDGYLKPGAYDVLDGIEVIVSDAISVNLALSYNRYGPDGKKLLKCEGVYCVTNNNGKWGIQLISTIFTPADLVNVTYGDTIEAAKRIRLNHDLAYQVDDEEGVWARVRQYGTIAGVGGGGRGRGTVWQLAPEGRAMEHFEIKGIDNRLAVSEATSESLAKFHVDFAAYRALFAKTGVGNWGFACGIQPNTRVLHATVDKAHMYSGVTRYTVAGEEISNSVEVSIITYKKGRWGWAGSLSYITTHDRANDVHS